TVFTNHVDYEQTYPEFRSLQNLVVLDRVPLERSFGRVLRAAATIARQKLDLREFDALLVASEGLGDFITFRNRARPILCFCHTPARPVYDPVYRRVWLERHPHARLPLAVFAALQRRAAGDTAITFQMNPSTVELEALYDRCYALVFPSLNEDWGIVPLEAMAHGKPVLAVNSGGPTESVVDGETGFLLEPSAAAFATKMTWLVEHSEEARRMGVAAVARAK